MPVFPVVAHPPAAAIVDQLVFEPSVVRNFPELPDCEGANALNPALAVFAPVPPKAVPTAVPFHVPVVIVPNVLIEF
jgi:hypothetical protein